MVAPRKQTVPADDHQDLSDLIASGLRTAPVGSREHAALVGIDAALASLKNRLATVADDIHDTVIIDRIKGL